MQKIYSHNIALAKHIIVLVLSLCASTTFFSSYALADATTPVLNTNTSQGNVEQKTNTDSPKKKPVEVQQSKEIVFETSEGTITIKTLPKSSPITVANFVRYVEDGFYDNTVFHRVIPGFVVQGGGFSNDLQRKATRPSIENESKNRVKNETGTLSMARTNDPNSATSQFFINLSDNSNLDYRPQREGYAVFAKVINGIDIVRKIERLPRGQVPGFREAPNTLPVIKRAYIKSTTAKAK